LTVSSGKVVNVSPTQTDTVASVSSIIIPSSVVRPKSEYSASTSFLNLESRKKIERDSGGPSDANEIDHILKSIKLTVENELKLQVNEKETDPKELAENVKRGDKEEMGVRIKSYNDINRFWQDISSNSTNLLEFFKTKSHDGELKSRERCIGKYC